MSTKASCEVLGSLEFIPESWPLVIFLLTVCYSSCILVWLINVCAHVCTLGGPIDNRGRCVIYYHMISASSSLFPVPLSFTSAYIINCAHMLALLSLESRVLIIGQHVLAHDPVDTFSGTWTLKCQLDLHPRPECPGVWIFQTFTSIPSLAELDKHGHFAHLEVSEGSGQRSYQMEEEDHSVSDQQVHEYGCVEA